MEIILQQSHLSDMVRHVVNANIHLKNVLDVNQQQHLTISRQQIKNAADSKRKISRQQMKNAADSKRNISRQKTKNHQELSSVPKGGGNTAQYECNGGSPLFNCFDNSPPSPPSAPSPSDDSCSKHNSLTRL